MRGCSVCVRVCRSLVAATECLLDTQGDFLRANEDYIVAHNIRRLRKEQGLDTSRTGTLSIGDGISTILDSASGIHTVGGASRAGKSMASRPGSRPPSAVTNRSTTSGTVGVAPAQPVTTGEGEQAGPASLAQGSLELARLRPDEPVADAKEIADAISNNTGAWGWYSHMLSSRQTAHVFVQLCTRSTVCVCVCVCVCVDRHLHQHLCTTDGCAGGTGQARQRTQQR